MYFKYCVNIPELSGVKSGFKNMINYGIYTIILLLLLISCVSSNPTHTSMAAKAKDSPSEVVLSFLGASMKNNFAKAYNYIYFPGTDKAGYVSQMENLVNKSHNKIKSYKLIGTRIIGDQSFVIYELELIIGDDNGKEQNLRYTRNQFELALIDSHWKIVKDFGCIENCVK